MRLSRTSRLMVLLAAALLWSLPCNGQTGIGQALARWWSGVHYSDEYIKKNKAKALVEIPEVFELANIAFNEYMTWAAFMLYAHDNYDAQTFKTVSEKVANQMVNDRKFPRFREFSDQLLELYVSQGEGQFLVGLYPAILDWSQGKANTAEQANDTSDKVVTILKASPDIVAGRPGNGFKVTYRWQAVPLEKDYAVFVHLVDANGRTVLQDDHEPPTPTSVWNGKIEYPRTVPLEQWQVKDKRTISIGLAEGEYAIYAGLYDKQNNRPALRGGPGVTDVGENRYKIGILSIDKNAPIPAAGSKTLDLTGYHVAFAEEFDDLSVSARGPTGPGGTRWIAHTPWRGDFGDARFTDPGPSFPFTVKDGILRIEAAKKDGRWRSGLLSAVDPKGNGFKQQYGYFECRAKFPKGPGTWPAFWLMGLKNLKGLPGNVGPRVNPEIDVVEHYGHWPWRYHYVLHQWGRDGTQSKHEGKRFVVLGMEEDFHTYGVMINEEHVILYFDGVELHREKTPESVKTPLFPLVNLALGPGWPTDKTPDPSYMYVDYVRVWGPSK